MAVVRVFVLDSQERVLLVKSDYKKTGPENVFWIVPGGMIEKGEFSRDAAIREVKEETGLDISVKKLLWVEESRNSNGEVNFIHYFWGEIIGGQTITGSDPELDADNQVILDVQFKSKEEIKSLPVVYPEVLLDEFWEVIRTASTEHDPWRVRPSKGFGIR